MVQTPVSPSSPSPSVADRVLGLEAVRALAIAAVIAYHLNIPGVLNAGFLGVDIFFNLSGFLITSLLLREYQTHGRIALGAFYLRRIKRLFPANAMLLVGCVILAIGWMGVAYQARLRADFAAATIYGSNWWQIHSEQSYFANFGSPPLLRHLWSLAVEMQFYAIWPLLLGMVLRWAGVGGAMVMSLGLSLASALWMAWIFMTHETNPSRAYLGSDTHTMGLFLGAAMACWWSPLQNQSLWQLEKTALGKPLVRTLLGVGGVIALYVMLSTWTDVNPILYYGGFWLVSLCSVLLIVISCSGELSLGWAQGLVRWMGTRSYSMYLWHWPIFVFLKGDTTPDTAMVVLCLASTAVASELSYRLVELRKNITLLSLIVLLFAASAASFFLATEEDANRAAAQQTIPTEMLDNEALKEASSSDRSTEPVIPASKPRRPASGASAASAARALTPSNPNSNPPPAAPLPPLAQDAHILAIGDSVMLGARHRIEQGIPGILVDAQVGRQASHSVPIVNDHLLHNQRIERVVLHIGTNGYIYEKDLRKLLSLLQEKGVQRVLVVNIHADRRWTKTNNELIDRIAPEFANVRIGRWSAVSSDNPDYFVRDGIHLSSAGVSAFVKVIGAGLGVELIPPPTRPVKEAKPPPKPTPKISSPPRPPAESTRESAREAAVPDTTTETKDGKNAKETHED